MLLLTFSLKDFFIFCFFFQDWSDNEDEGHSVQNSSSDDITNLNESPIRLNIQQNHIKPPRKELFYTEFKSSQHIAWKYEAIQSPWWNIDSHKVNVNSGYAAANVNCLSNETNASTVSEWCLLREILWMLKTSPHSHENQDILIETKKTSKFFSINFESNEIVVNPNVTLASVSVIGIHSILCEFAEFMTILYRFRDFFHAVFRHTTETAAFIETSITIPPLSLQYYANGLKEFESIVANAVSAIEIDLIQQNPTKIFTVAWLYQKLLSHIQLFRVLFSIHSNVYIDFKSNPGNFTSKRSSLHSF